MASTGAPSFRGTVDSSRGYRGSAPVRIGNGAANQMQLDIYGALLDAVYLNNKYGTPMYHDAWRDLTRIVEWLSEHCDQADEGIWDPRPGVATSPTRG
jgi:GH15 family glucan-1,4-alpha-glucosidase